MKKNGTPASPAVAFASKVFPVPGGPTSKTPLGNLAPNFSKRLGSFKKSIISLNSISASPAPPMSEKCTPVISPCNSLALDLPNEKIPPPAPCMFLKIKYQIIINGSIGSKIPISKSINPSLLATPPNLISELASLSINNGSKSLTTLLMLSDCLDFFFMNTTPFTIGRFSTSPLTASFKA